MVFFCWMTRISTYSCCHFFLSPKTSSRTVIFNPIIYNFPCFFSSAQIYNSCKQYIHYDGCWQRYFFLNIPIMKYINLFWTTVGATFDIFFLGKHDERRNIFETLTTQTKLQYSYLCSRFWFSIFGSNRNPFWGEFQQCSGQYSFKN